MRRPFDGAPSRVPVSLFKRDGSITQAPDTADVAERGYDAIIRLLESGALRLRDEVRAAAGHRSLPPIDASIGLFRQYLLSGRCAALEDFWT